jgi:MOSC domain-containing protein YiiM
VNNEIEILHCYISPAHNFFGHHGQPAGTQAMIEVPQIECITARGIRGDRFFDYAENYKGQITFFADEVFQGLCERLGIWDKSPAVLRRNIITRGIDLNELIGVEFEIHGGRFIGTEECKPCYWMDRALHPGAEAAMRGRGGLRARILKDCVLHPARNQFALPRDTVRRHGGKLPAPV